MTLQAKTEPMYGNIAIKNVYHMLAYAFRSVEACELRNVAAEEFENIHNLFAAILSAGISRQLKHGLHREYLLKTEDLTTLRGKIHVAGSLRHRMHNRLTLACEYDELSENNLLTQILKTTALLLIRSSDVEAQYRNQLSKTLLFFSEVSPLNPRDIKWDTIRLGRNTRSYRLLLSVCQLVIEGLLITEDRGDYQLRSFLYDQAMSALFERFVAAYYHREWPSLNVTSPYIKWALDDPGMKPSSGSGTDASGVAKSMLPAMHSDIVLTRGNTVLIIDTKYYTRSTQYRARYDSRTIHSSHLYQIFAYVKNMQHGLGPDSDVRVAGMLLYARTLDQVQPNEVFQLSGNQISAQTLDLGLPFTEVRAQLDAIAAAHFP